MQIAVIVERAKEEDTEWTTYAGLAEKKIRIPTEPCPTERFTLTVVITTAYVAHMLLTAI